MIKRKPRIEVMKKNKLFLCAFLIFFLIYASQAQDNFIVIVNQSVEESSVTISELRRIYFGFTPSWKSGSNVRVSHSEFSDQEFMQKILTTKSNYKQFWMKREKSGNGMTPVSLSNSTSMIDYVSSTKGAIGIIDNSDQHLITDSCKIITVSD